MAIENAYQDKNGNWKSYTGSMENVRIPDGARVVGKDIQNTFTSDEVRTVWMPDTVEVVEAKAFEHCANLESITLSRNLKIIKGAAFMGCSKLRSVSLPKSLERIGTLAFSDTAVDEFFFAGTMEEFKRIEKTEGEQAWIDHAPTVHCTDGDFFGSSRISRRVANASARDENDRRILNRFMDDWDSIIRQWHEGNRRNHQSETPFDPLCGCGDVAFVRDLFDISERERDFCFQPGLMPEPYWGNPLESSIVIAHHNPGGHVVPDWTRPRAEWSPHEKSLHWFMDRVSESKYSTFATPAPIPIFEPPTGFESYGGVKWWKPVANWAARVTQNLPGWRAGRFPFGIELCGWHSKTWPSNRANSVMLDPRNRNHFLRFVVEPLESAIRQSDTKTCFALGDVYADLAIAAGFESVAGPGMVPGERKRSFQLFAKDGMRILATWYRGGQKTPAREFDRHIIDLLFGGGMLVP